MVGVSLSIERLHKAIYNLTCTLKVREPSQKLWRFIINKKYDYPHLKQTPERGEILLRLLKPQLKPEDNFLDMMCGYSPLAAPLLKQGYKITGFDNSKEVISSLKENSPEGFWFVSSFENLKLKGILFSYC